MKKIIVTLLLSVSLVASLLAGCAPEEIGTHSRANFPLIWFEGPVDAGSIVLRNLVRVEKTLPVATVRVEKPAKVRHLTIRDCRMENLLQEPIPFVENRGEIGKLTLENNDFAGGEWIGSK